MPHSLIAGMTESGKTTLAKRLARLYKKDGVPIIVLDPYRSKSWEGNFVTDCPDTFLKVVKRSRSCALFVDEAGDYYRKGFKSQLEWLATNSRHYGHNCHFISQRATQLPPTIRDQCSNVFLFRQSYDDARELARNFASDSFMFAPELSQFEYLGKVGFDGKVFRAKVVPR